MSKLLQGKQWDSRVPPTPKTLGAAGSMVLPAAGLEPGLLP